MMNETFEKRKTDVIVFALLLGVGFFINREIEIKGLYMDDLYLWSCYGEQTFTEYVFPVGGTRFRFIFYLLSYVLLGLIGTHVNYIVGINIILNVCVAFTLYAIGKKLGKSAYAGLLCGIAYLVSRMSYYQIGQLYGLMETFALWAAIGILYCLYVYLNESSLRHFAGANILYFAVCFIHERYLVLLPVILWVLVLKRIREIRIWAWPVVTFALVMGIRFVTIGSLSPAGTAGTDVADTFQLGQAVKFALSQAAYVFGINAGPDHLNGLSFLNTPGNVKLLILAANLLLLILVILFLADVIGCKKPWKGILANCSLFIGFIMMCIGSSSVTIRVEMRWVYVSYAASLLFLSYIMGTLGRRRMAAATVLFLGYVCLLIPGEMFYRSHFSNLYLWPNQLRYNSLAEETYETYGDDIFGKTIYIIGNTYEMSEFTADTFFKVYDKNRTAEGLTVIKADSIRDFGQVTENMIILTEDPAHNGFTDITSFVRNQKCEILEGYYRDGWMDQRADIRVMAGADGMITFEGYYPGELKGTEVMEISIGENGKEKQTVALSSQEIRFQIQALPYQQVLLSFDNNFYTEDAQEQRGEERMALIVNIITD